MKVTMKEVANKAGVSKTTVSRILNGNYNQVSEMTKQKVLTIINELEYEPNILAKGLKSSKTNIIGIVLSNLKNPFWITVLEGVEDTCHQLGYQLMICNTNENNQLEQEHIKSLYRHQVDGIIANPTVKNKEIYKSLLREKLPLVAINRKIEGLNMDIVLMDNIKGARLAVDHLFKLNKRNIAILLYTPDVTPRADRLEGYKQMLMERGIIYKEKYVKVIKESRGEVKKAVKDLFKGDEMPDAVFSTNNTMTLEAMEALKELGLKVPFDISLVGYDETLWSKHLAPPLTTISQPAYEMGQEAAKRLIKRINFSSNDKKQIKILEPGLIVRESCGAELGKDETKI